MADLPLSPQRLRAAYERVASTLLDEATPQGFWTGELSTSALSTATAVMALDQVARAEQTGEHDALIARGLHWLAESQNADGGWGDTDASVSNISTTMLAHATLHSVDRDRRHAAVLERAQRYIDHAGGVEAVRRRYGRDHTFAAPILTHCALAGLVGWNDIPALPFELGCLPHRFYKLVNLPVVSYALPALIAIGQVQHAHRPSRNPCTRWIRTVAVPSTLRLLESIQPSSGGFLEAVPLTSFVVMSLAACGRVRHPVVTAGVRFLQTSVRDDGSWAIDSNLATWVTTLSINALAAESLPHDQALAILDWMLDQQFQTVHPYTGAAPGGWAWTDLPGGVPDADDTPGAMLALMKLARRPGVDRTRRDRVERALSAAGTWLLDLQNRDGGWPTFCRGWGALPFDRSAADLTAHAIRALKGWRDQPGYRPVPVQSRRIERALTRGLSFLTQTQRPDGSWLPLWFGNQHAPDDMNPVYGTSRVLAMYRDLGLKERPEVVRAVEWLVSAQTPDGGWGGAPGCPPSLEETALAVEALLPMANRSDAAQRGVCWIVERVENELYREPAPIGFYFAKLWYYERLYPLILAASALRRAASALLFHETDRLIPVATSSGPEPA